MTPAFCGLRGVFVFLMGGMLASLSAASGHAQAPAGPGAPIAAPPAAAAGANPTPPTSEVERATSPRSEAAAAAESPSDDVAEAPAPLTSATSSTRSELEKELQVLDGERAKTSNLWPWVTVATGATAVFAGTLIGVVSAFGCTPNTLCAAPPISPLIVVVGAGIGTAGAIWLVRIDDDIRDIELKKTKIQNDLELLDRASLRSRGIATLGTPTLQLSASF